MTGRAVGQAAGLPGDQARQPGSPRHEPIGLLAGSGRFPVMFADKARSLHRPVICVGIRGEADAAALAPLVHRYYPVGLARMGRMIRCFQKEGVREVVMAGKIQKTRLFVPLLILRYLPDWRTFKFWYRMTTSDKRDDTLLLGVIREFERDGLQFSSALDYCPELLVKHGVLTQRTLSASEEADIRFGWELAKE